VPAIDWGLDEPPRHFGPGLLAWGPVDTDDAGDLPEVAAGRAEGYLPAPEDLLWCFVPALWPRSARAWVRDRRVRHSMTYCAGGPVVRTPWSAAVYAEVEDTVNRLLAELDLPSQPAGRIWLLRPPAGHATAADLIAAIWADWRASGGLAMATPELVAYVDDRLGLAFEAEGR
jgi:hypothetical protein